MAFWPAFTSQRLSPFFLQTEETESSMTPEGRRTLIRSCTCRRRSGQNSSLRDSAFLVKTAATRSVGSSFSEMVRMDQRPSARLAGGEEEIEPSRARYQSVKSRRKIFSPCSSTSPVSTGWIVVTLAVALPEKEAVLTLLCPSSGMMGADTGLYLRKVTCSVLPRGSKTARRLNSLQTVRR